MVKRLVFKCFKSFEKLSNRLISKTGPFFVVLALSLITISNITYFEVIFYHQFLKSTSNPIYTILILFFSLYLSFCLLFYYFLSFLVEPGSILTNHHQQPQNHTFRFNFLSSNRFRKSTLTYQNQKIINSINKHSNQSSSNKKSIPHQQEQPSTTTPPPPPPPRRCTKCLMTHPELSIPPLKPPRAHHCRICGVCWLKYDHHCPWINQCVGLHNERYFLLFLVYMTISNIWVTYWGWTSFLISTNFNSKWEFNSPRLFVILTWVLNLVIGITVGIMMSWQLILIGKGESSVESSDNEYYSNLLKKRGLKFKHPYDLGIKQNFIEFFNLRHQKWYTVLIPKIVLPSTNGWQWIKRDDWNQSEYNDFIKFSDELTDEEEDDN
ncbi:uncharacterized protein MELLADRAFT_94100 [Melampsora larici-populina 98AG31]|uniref:Palmitoyltransferase n=1 Tax=Melampsora larici-populina (strain 98AG31 / pathotype 3-4-7) TaxID=747676 RepID=F4S6E4_MELLP|nr:uncharacterized protein MELLADRAFT_94100 [Melampsora larici-populina 98AG31]EGF99808.1 hypothetical protein MELLADRAFT_94100 [Melampsora larici-populina 98AG31]